MSDAIITRKLYEALHLRHQPPEWALFNEVPSMTGGGVRSADAVAMNLYASRGHRVHGFEVKASRGDWLRELRDPSKSEPIQRFCHHWWVVTPKGLVLDGELPPTWGLLELCGGVLRQKVKAPKLDAQPMSVPFIAAILRRASQSSDADIRAAVDKRTEVMRAQMNETIERRVKERTERLNSKAAMVEKVEEAFGDLRPWGNQPLIDAINYVRKVGVADSYGVVRNAITSMRRFLDSVGDLVIDAEEVGNDQ